MHHLYHTVGFVLGSISAGEANRAFRIFTRDLGLIHARAQGVRYLKSKLRYNLHDFSFCDLSLVRGRELWRVTGAVKRADLYAEFHDTPEMLRVFACVFSLLLRLLSGEEKNELLFRHIEEAVVFARVKKQPAEAVRNFEYILVLRILSSLGYLGSSPDTEAFVETPYWSDELLVRMNMFIPKVLGEINKSLKESQL